jgi:ribonuclease HI
MYQNKKNLIVFDACCHIPEAHIKGRSKKGKSACGVLIINNKNDEFEFKKYLGECTVPEAEFKALIFALDKASEIIKRNEDIEIRSDSDLVIRWMKGDYRLRKQHIKSLFDEAKKLENRFKNVEYLHQPRGSRLVQRVDELAQEAYKEFIS